MRGRNRVTVSWAVSWALICALLTLATIVQAGDAAVSAGRGSPWASEIIAKARIKVAPSSVSLGEGGEPVAYTVVLTKRPSAPVIVNIETDDQTAANLALLLFEPSDWDKPQGVSVRAVDDTIGEGDHNSTVSHRGASTDPNYSGLDGDVLTVQIEDNDPVGILVSPSELTVAEPNGSAALTFTLASHPGTGVTVPLETSNMECAISPPSVVLDAENWQSGVEAMVSAVDDSIEDGEQTCLIEGRPSSSSNPAYNGLVPDTVTVTVLDDEGGWQLLMPLAIRRWPPLPDTPTLQTIDNADGRGTYSVQWEASARAKSYVLEEGTDPAFTTAQERYSGPATAFDVSEQGASRLFYRVKAQNDWGDSAWSATQKVDVLWEAEPNEDASTMKNGPLVPGLVYKGILSTGQDPKDYFFIDLPSERSVQLWLQNVPTGNDYDLVLWDSDLQTQPGWYSQRSGNQDEYVEATVPAGLYHVQVYRASGPGSSQPYHLQVQY